MKILEYVITDKDGIHARPAGILAKMAANYTSTITISKGEKKADMKHILSLMGLCVQYGNWITITIEGEDEEDAYNSIERFFTENL